MSLFSRTNRVNPFRVVILRLAQSQNSALLFLAVAVGLATSAGIWLFYLLIDVFALVFDQGIAEDLLGPVMGKFGVIFSLAFAGLIVGHLLHKFVGSEKYRSVPGIIESVALSGGRLPYRLIPFKMLASSMSMGAGASVGPQDPSVQIGSNIGSWFGQRLHLKEERVQLLVAAGAASAISAAFQTPIAGVFFALEVVLSGSMQSSAVGVVVLAAVVSSAATQAIDVTPEIVPLAFELGGPLEIVYFLPLGLLLAPIAAAFIRFIYAQYEFWQNRIQLSRALKTAFAGALVGAVGVFLPEIMGTGRDPMNAVLQGEAEYALLYLAALAVFKIVMTGISMGGGFAGGFLAPTLFAGTMLGSIYGIGVERLFGDLFTGDVRVFAVAGMAGMMAGVVRSPITAIMLVFELTNDYRLILPIMLTAVICIFFAERFHAHGIYTHGLVMHGIHIRSGRDIDVMQGVTVEEAMVSPAPTISENASLLELRDALRHYRSRTLCVVGEKGRLSGIVTLSDLQSAYSRKGEAPKSVSDICTRSVVTVNPDDVLWAAIRVMGMHDVGRLPVVNPGTQELVGIVGRHNVMDAYNVAIARKLEDQHHAERVRLNTLTGAHVFEVHVRENAPLSGMLIRDVNWPDESLVASIQRHGKLILPHGSTELLAGDLLTIVAHPASAPILERLSGRQPLSASG